MRLVTERDWRLFILANSPAGKVAIDSDPDAGAIKITVCFKWWVLRRDRALRRLRDRLEPHRPLGFTLTVQR